MCRKDLKNKRFNIKINDNRKGTRKTKKGCVVCNIFLCRKGDYIKRFYNNDSDMKFIK